MTNVDTTIGQTGRSTRGRTPIWRLAINGEEIDVVVIEAQFLFAKNQHDYITMVMSSETITDTSDMTDKPIFFAFGQAPRIESFYGYVVAVGESSANTKALQFSMMIMGATRTMQGGTPRFWRDRSISGAVKELVLTNGLGYAGQDHEHRWKALAQTNDSDWATILRFAKRLGWDVFNRWGVVLCYDPEKVFQERGSYTNLVAGSEDEYNTQDQRLLLDFEATEESDETPESIGQKMGFFNGEKPQIVTQGGAFKRYKFKTDLVIRDKAEADIYESAGNLADSYDTQKATARLYGEADLYPGMSVDVTTSNARVYRGKFDGRWLIDAVNHKMDRSSYQTQLILSRPGKARIRDLPYRSFWDIEGRSRPHMYLNTVITSLPVPDPIGNPDYLFQPQSDLIDGKISPGEVIPSLVGGWMSTWADRNLRTLIGGTR